MQQLLDKKDDMLIQSDVCTTLGKFAATILPFFCLISGVFALTVT